MTARRPTPRIEAISASSIPREVAARTSLSPAIKALIVAAILLAHYGTAAVSLLGETPTIDEVNHLPAGISYWQKGTFKLYHHNPPLVKLWAALPVRDAKLDRLYDMASWRSDMPAPSAGGGILLAMNPSNYLDIFATSRLVMPVFSVVAGLVIFAWSRRLWGYSGGLLSLTLWCLCPNVLAHCRLITSDVGAAALGIAATYAFWRYRKTPTWAGAILAGVVLGLAQLTKFSLLLLYPLFPVLWLVGFITDRGKSARFKTLRDAAVQGVAIVAISVIVIDLGYGFEGVGRPLGSFDFASRSFLTRPGVTRRHSANDLLDASWMHRVNRFRGTWMAPIPSPLPAHYLLGFDEQKIEADGVPVNWLDSRVTDLREMTGYPVYLNGVNRRTGWRSYYVLAMWYKMPEGTLLLLALSGFAAFRTVVARASIADEVAVLLPAAMFLGAMTFLTDINLGLRYVLPIFPFLFVAAGRLAAWAEGFSGRARVVARSAIVAGLIMTFAATASIHPSYLAYFNVISGGPDRRPPHLIDSNLDWGQDLENLGRWARAHPRDQPIGVAYFGQIPPDALAARGEGFRWFLPPIRPKTFRESFVPDPQNLRGFAPRMTPGVYAVSATLVAGLPYRVYDPAPRPIPAVWRVERDAFGYFRDLTPFANIGHSILLFRVTPQQAGRFNSSVLNPESSPSGP